MRRTTILSPRESTVLQLTAWGYSNKDIANRLGVSIKTIEAHKYTGMSKLQCSNRVQLMRHAVREGWLQLAEERTLVEDNSKSCRPRASQLT